MNAALTLSHLILENFRSHRQATFPLGPVTVLVGHNGAGKTNLLESLWCLATTRSFRTSQESEMVAWGAPAALIRADQFEVRLICQPSFQKLLFINGAPRRPLDYLGEVRAVVFTPDSLAIVAGPPVFRRRFLDTLLAQSDRQVARDLLAYRRVVSERNALLRLIGQGRAHREELSPWDSQLARLGARLIRRRMTLLEHLAPQVKADYWRFGGANSEELSLAYQTTAGPEPGTFTERLQATRDQELRLQATLVGPHRDNFLMTLNDRPIADYGSRGEIRTALLALKSAEYQFHLSDRDPQAESGRPLLLLDELFSELDENHRQGLSEFTERGQTVLTTTELAYLPKQLARAATVIEVTKEIRD